MLWEFLFFCYLHKAAILNCPQHKGTFLLPQGLASCNKQSMYSSVVPQLKLCMGEKAWMGDVPKSKKFGRHGIIHGQIRLLCLRSLQLKGQKFILQISRMLSKFENFSFFTVSPEQPLSHIPLAIETFTQGERKM